ncbi:MAG TPA: class I SAM-dependent methyltransferase [Candidatus Limnocylindria bacterium]|jgi:SAM-dependent methyltransferase|nr:class I SAM-dependent methyltransferase [Candidatus Limnocylindria bacterium]
MTRIEKTVTPSTAPAPSTPVAPDIQSIKARQKATWESGDFGEVAKHIMVDAESFMARVPLRPGMRVLDAACGTGNLAVLAAQRGCGVSGLDIAANLIVQARSRAQKEGLGIEFTEGDAEEMPYPSASFDAVVSMYGVMFAPRPERVVSELCRVVKPGGIIALANWTPDGFIGKMFTVFSRHLPPPAGIPSPLLWGSEAVVRQRFAGCAEELNFTRSTARMCFPFSPAGTVDFFRRYYGPTHRAFGTLSPSGQAALLQDLIELQTRHNISPRPNETETPSEYLKIHAIRTVGV